jgi:hypothetical protein
MQELTPQEIDKVDGGSTVGITYGVGAANAALVGAACFGPAGAVGSFLAFTGGFFIGSIYNRFAANRP